MHGANDVAHGGGIVVGGDEGEVFVPDGHPLDHNFVRSNAKGNAVDSLVEIPAVGRNGGPSIGPNNFLGIQ